MSVEKRYVMEYVPSWSGKAEMYERMAVEVNCCGEWLRVSGRFTTTCDHCYTDYNSSGQQLAPREYWGEETGEHWSECY
jgi:hypothetical protein